MHAVAELMRYHEPAHRRRLKRHGGRASLPPGPSPALYAKTDAAAVLRVRAHPTAARYAHAKEPRQSQEAEQYQNGGAPAVFVPTERVQRAGRCGMQLEYHEHPRTLGTLRRRRSAQPDCAIG